MSEKERPATWTHAQIRLGRAGDAPDGVEDEYLFKLSDQSYRERRKGEAILYIGQDGSLVAVEVFAENLPPATREARIAPRPCRTEVIRGAGWLARWRWVACDLGRRGSLGKRSALRNERASRPGVRPGVPPAGL